MSAEPNHHVADSIRKVTATIQQEQDAGRRSSCLDAHDLVDILLAIADAIDPPFAPRSCDDRGRKPQRPDR